MTSPLANRLDQETSPYLLQHAGNPVQWQPWDAEALQHARSMQKPILLSIGYSACHWCHVMAHESFEDPGTGALMNEHFVNIKIDREERPDLDRVYQLAHQLLTRQGGGWPLTMFLDPDTLIPFFGGTYFPKTPRHGLPGFPDLLTRIAEVFATRRDELRTQGERITQVLAELVPAAPAEAALGDRALLDAARDQLEKQYDPVEGGFGGAPKFPMPSTLQRLLRHWAFTRSRARGEREKQDRQTLDMVMITLTQLARGGICDHLGGGFFRYATDARWMIPHFEKMLYDNGQLLSLYADALGLGPDALFEQAVADTTEWLLREMRHPEGPFFASLDADSEGSEGAFYVWRRDQVKQALTTDEYLVVETLYGLDKPANFEGRWNLHRGDSWRSVVSRLSLQRDEADALLASARGKLLTLRDQRPRPALDDKILTGWNGLTIKGLAEAGMRLDRPEWIAAAQRAADFLRANLFVDGVLYATWKAGRARHPGYLDDYAYLLDGLLALLRAEWRDADARFARTLAEGLLARFEDRDHGGFFFTAHDHEALIHRPKPAQDDATPSGNGVAAAALQSLGHLFAEPRYLDASDRTIIWARGMMERHPAGHCGLLNALEGSLAEPEQIILRGPGAELAPWRALASEGLHPWREVFAIPYEGAQVLPPYLPKLANAEFRKQVVAYRCQGLQCSPPIASLDAFRRALAD